jgi:hypothetical protein
MRGIPSIQTVDDGPLPEYEVEKYVSHFLFCSLLLAFFFGLFSKSTHFPSQLICRCRMLVTQYLDANESDAAIHVGDMRKIQACYRIMKVCG